MYTYIYKICIHVYTYVYLCMYTGKRYGQHGKAGHDAYHALLAEDKTEEALLLPYFQDTFQPKVSGQHGKAGHDA